jgi:hypothetical protein
MKKVNDKFIDELREEYESIFEDGSGKMKVSKGKVVEYLGMTLVSNYWVQCSVDYVKECIRPLIRMRRMIARRSRRARHPAIYLLSIPTARNFPRPGARSSTVW